MKRTFVFITLALAMSLVTGCMFDSNDKDDVKKGSVTGKITMIVTGEPVAGVKVMLVNMNAKIDTTNYAKNAAAFVDSAVTGADGSYIIDGIAPGNYGIIPVQSSADTIAVYKFTASQNSGTYEFVMNGNSLTVNFIAEHTNAPGASASGFTIDVYFKTNNKLDNNSIKIYRRLWVWFIPDWMYHASGEAENAGEGKVRIRIDATYGYTYLAYSIDNYFQIRFNADDQPRTVDVGFGVSNCPAYSKFEYDMALRTLTRLE